MKYYLISVGLILLGVTLSWVVPLAFDSTGELWTNSQIPQNNSNVAGIQKYNAPPVRKNLPIPPFSAREVFIKDLSTGTLLYQKDADAPIEVGSTAKIMTALVASSYYKQNSPLTVGEGSNISGSRIGLFGGEDLSFRSLLYGMLLSSGNDAAYTIAENFPGGVLGFVSQMNKKAKELQLTHTGFDNPVGFDSDSQYSSARDLSVITEEALKDSTLSRIFATRETDIVSLDKKYTHKLSNLNKLLSQVSGVLGVKTGTTPESKENLVTLVERSNKRVLIVLLGSDDRYGETTQLIDWVYNNFQWSIN